MTNGERLLGRTLEREKRGGVDHYVPGQHEAKKAEEEGVFDLGYVDQMGHAILVVVARADDTWTAAGVIRAGQTQTSGLHVPGVNGFEFELSEKMIAALERAL